MTGVNLLGETRADLGIKDGVFVPLDALDSDHTVVDGDGLAALPGLVDLHTHLRQPGMEHAETVLTGSQAAALGGFTAIHAMANTQPTTDSPDAVQQVWDWGRQAGYTDVRPVGAVTRGLRGEELADIAGMAGSEAAPRVFSDDGHCVSDSALMRDALRAARQVGAVVAQHAQDPSLTVGSQMNAGALADRLGLTGWPSVAEESIIARDALLAEALDARLHVCHVSTAGSLDVVRWAKARGISITAEVTPHHLLLTEDLVSESNPLFKVNPPLRTREDTLALREGIASGIIDIVATDHAPHPAESKNCAFDQAAFGMVGLETALAVVLETLVEPGLLRLRDVARVMSTKPAEIGGVAGYGEPFRFGQPAHLALVDPSRPTPEPSGSLSRNNPYLGRALRGTVVHTFYRGVATVADGKLVKVLPIERTAAE